MIEAPDDDAIRDGMYQKQAAQAAGIAESTFHEWMTRGQTGEQPFQEFSESIKRARAEAEYANVAIIRRAAEEGTWQAAAWWLERSLPKLWGRCTEHTVITRDAMIDLITELEAELAENDTEPDLLEG